MISVLNFKRYEQGALIGFFDLRYYGLTIKGYKLMAGNDGGLWIAPPQRQAEINGETKYLDIVELTRSEAEHVRRLVISDLQLQGHIEAPKRQQQAGRPLAHQVQRRLTPEGEDVTEFYTQGGDNITF